MENPNERLALEFIKTLETRTSPDEVMHFYHPDVEHSEFPNALTETTALRDFDALRESSLKGQQVLQKERYEITNTFSFGNQVLVEANWTGTLAVPLGNLPAGGEIRAHTAQLFEFKDGKIFRQRNYDCFHPFGYRRVTIR
jgi:hypothetical protein